MMVSVNGEAWGDGAAALESLAATAGDTRYLLRLFVIGVTAQSSRAVVNVRKLLELHLAGRYDLEVIDISQHPDRAKSEQIIAAPTLVKLEPLPLRRFIGDMSRTETILKGLDLDRREP